MGLGAKILIWFMLAAGLGSTAVAQDDEQWEGTWKTTYGEIRLVENGNYVYGDYGSIGTIQGILTSNRQVLRATFKRNDNGSKGYVEWVQSGDDGDRIFGRWNWASRPLPTWNISDSGSIWKGNRIASSRPSLLVIAPNTRRNSFLVRETSEYRRWVLR